MPDYVRDAGAAAIGARLRRLSERVDNESRQLHAAAGIAFEQRWLGILDLLSTAPMTVSELAERLGISHPSVSEFRKSLEAHGLVVAERDKSDGRRRLLTLTPAGEALVVRLRPLWAALDQAAIALDEEAGQVVDALEKLERALARKSLAERVRTLLPPKE